MDAKASAAPDTLLDTSLRRIVATDFKGTRPLEGAAPEVPGLSWQVLSADEASGHQVILVRAQAGGRGPVHRHDGPEEFLILDGTVTDSDGTVFKAGDFLHYDAGSSHDTDSDTGCTLLVIARKGTDPAPPAPTAAAHGALLDVNLRRVIATADAPFRPFDRYGAPMPGLRWLPLSLEKDGGHAVYLLRFAPGARGPAHEHAAPEAFLVMEGTFTDCDGTVFHAGDYVHYDAGSKHFSYSETGCVILVILRQRNVAV